MSYLSQLSRSLQGRLRRFGDVFFVYSKVILFNIHETITRVITPGGWNRF